MSEDDLDRTQRYVPLPKSPSEMPQDMVAYFRVISGPDEGKQFPVKKSQVVLGRAKGSDICLSDKGLSRAQAQVSYANREFRIADLGSANGTLLNGSQVKEYALRNGDKVTVGSTVLQFVVEKV